MENFSEESIKRAENFTKILENDAIEKLEVVNLNMDLEYSRLAMVYFIFFKIVFNLKKLFNFIRILFIWILLQNVYEILCHAKK